MAVEMEKPVHIGELAQEELDTELEKGYADIISGRAESAEKVFADIRKDYNL